LEGATHWRVRVTSRSRSLATRECRYAGDHPVPPQAVDHTSRTPDSRALELCRLQGRRTEDLSAPQTTLASFFGGVGRPKLVDAAPCPQGSVAFAGELEDDRIG
jgi:hypothetical protein